MAENINFTAENNPCPTAAELLKMLELSPNQFKDQYLSNLISPTFHEYLNKLMGERKLSASNLITEASISKTYAYQFINGERLPGRDIVLRLCLAMQLSLDEAQELLTLAGKSILYPRIKRDACILYCFRKKMPLDETNLFLEELGEAPLL